MADTDKTLADLSPQEYSQLFQTAWDMHALAIDTDVDDEAIEQFSTLLHAIDNTRKEVEEEQ